jgi:hypothetical protein
MSQFVSRFCASLFTLVFVGFAGAGAVTSPVVFSTGVKVEYSAVVAAGINGGSLVGKLSATGKTISATPTGGPTQAFGNSGKGQFSLTAYFNLTTGALIDTGHELSVTRKVGSSFETLYHATEIYGVDSRFWSPVNISDAPGQSSFTFDWARDAIPGTMVQSTNYAHIIVDMGTGGFLKDLNDRTSGFSFGGWGTPASNTVLFRNGYAVNGGLPSSALGTSNVYAVPIPLSALGGGAILATLGVLRVLKKSASKAM